ncbi:MAG: pyrrolo-quinoline quinone, partial [Acidobacteria bacterium]
MSNKPGRCKVTPCRHWFERPITAAILGMLVVGGAQLWSQNPPAAPSELSEAKKIFAVQCAGCHGPGAHGTDNGPPLAGVRELRGRSIPWLRNVIQKGIPSSGMPASPLPADQLDALAALVHSLNSPAAESAVPGDRAAGEQFFFGKGQCASCHMVYGRGEAVGPDLSSLAREMAVDEIRGALLEPSARVSPGYGLVTVHLQNGKSLRGFARSQSDYEVVVEDLEGRFHLLEGSQVSRIQEEKQSLMPPVKATPEELENLIAYLSRLTGAKTGTAKVEGRPEPGGISFSRILHPQPGDWLTYNGDLSGNRYSELAQINTTNVNTLGLKWIFSVPLWKQFLPDIAYYREN